MRKNPSLQILILHFYEIFGNIDFSGVDLRLLKKIIVFPCFSYLAYLCFRKSKIKFFYQQIQQEVVENSLFKDFLDGFFQTCKVYID